VERLLAVCLGGALGSGARFLLSEWAAASLGTAFPWGTFFVNALGSFLLAIVVYAGVEAAAISPTMRIALGSGVMGGFTTYSTFSFETMVYLENGSVGLAVLYVVATLAVGLGACMAGWWLARALFAAG
jgi:fluoride exporter